MTRYVLVLLAALLALSNVALARGQGIHPADFDLRFYGGRYAKNITVIRIVNPAPLDEGKWKSGDECLPAWLGGTLTKIGRSPLGDGLLIRYNAPTEASIDLYGYSPIFRNYEDRYSLDRCPDGALFVTSEDHYEQFQARDQAFLKGRLLALEAEAVARVRSETQRLLLLIQRGN